MGKVFLNYGYFIEAGLKHGSLYYSAVIGTTGGSGLYCMIYIYMKHKYKKPGFSKIFAPCRLPGAIIPVLELKRM